jgi:hypothetical protein
MKRIIFFVIVVCALFGSCKNNPTTPTPTPTPAKVYPKIDNFTASDSSVKWNTAVTLSWTTRDATRCVITPMIGDVPTSGSKSVILTTVGATTFTLTAENTDGAVTATRTVTATAAANFVLVGYSKDMTSYHCPVINGTVRNDGNATGYNVMISWSAYNAANTIIDTASGFPADLGNIPVGVSAVFDAVFFKLTAWSQISKLTWTMDWLDLRTGIRMRQVRELKIR